LTLAIAVLSEQLRRMQLRRPHFQPLNEEQMGSTFFGDTIAAAPRLVSPRQTQSDRGIDVRARGCA
jgi:hypothetical protein